MIRENCLNRPPSGYATLVTSLAVACLLGISPVNVFAQTELTETEQIIHVLNRLAYGPSAGDIERVREMGIPAYIEEQLNPETLQDSRADEKISGYWIVGKNFNELADYDRPAAARANRQRQNVQQRAERADYIFANGSDGSDGSVTDLADREKIVRRSLFNSAISSEVTRLDRPIEDDGMLIDTRLLRAVYSKRQLQEVMVDFWFNHFNIEIFDAFLGEDYTQNVIRPNALGNFEDLLLATATHPAMMYYLDNWLSSTSKEIVEKRLAAGHEIAPGSSGPRSLAMRTRQGYFDKSGGLNENYGRELMELHTLGVDGGYTQEDIIQVAKSFTGWTVTSVETGDPDGHFVFDPLIHESGDKVVLGQTIPSGGMDEGLQILHMLAHHPSTANFISTKLVRRFVADDPPAELVDIGSRAFIDSGGEISEVLRAIFMAPEFYSEEYYLGKMKKPLELVVSALRTVNADIDPVYFTPGNYLSQTLTQMGERLFRHAAPDGYPDVAMAWISTNALFKRMDFAIVLSTGNIPDVSVDIDAAFELFQQLEFPTPSPGQLAGVQSIAQNMSGNMMGNEMDNKMATDADNKMATDADNKMASDGGNKMATDGEDDSSESQNNMMGGAEAPSIGQEITDTKVLATVVALGSPRFQKR